MSEDIQTLVLNYIKDEVFEDELNKILLEGVSDIQLNIHEGPHTGLTSYEHGDLFGSVQGNIESTSQLSAVLRFYATADYASYQDEGTIYITPREFMKYGIEDLISNYGG